MQEEKIKILVCKYLNQSLTRAESEELEMLMRRVPSLRLLLDSLDDEEKLGPDLRRWERTDVDQNLQRTREQIDSREAPVIRSRRMKTIAMSCAAAVVMAVVIIGLASLPALTNDPAAVAVETSNGSSNNGNINPAVAGGTHATLMLIDRSIIRVDSFSAGKVIEQNNCQVTKQDDGVIAYRPLPGNPKKTPPYHQYNVLTVPTGGQACLILPDQTKVWLNNTSSLRYPVAFKGAYRDVYLKGEAYFEVTQDHSRPFRVQFNGMTIDVLGTHFAVSSYAEEQETRTTLMEGKIQVNTSSGPRLLNPGDQLITKDQDIQLLKDVDTEDAVAWKEGYFHFTHADINAVLRQLCRWYGLGADNRAPEIIHIYDGEISRNLSIDEVLKNLENDDVHFKVENKKIVVTR